MCTVAAGIIGSVLLSGVQGYANYQSQKEAIQAQADSQASMYKAQADAADYNAKIERKRQEQIADQYGEEARRLRARHRIEMGRVRAAAGAAGLDSAGSMLDIQASGQDAYTRDQMTLLGNQRNDNYASRVQQTNFENQAGSSRAAASNVLADADRQIGALKWNTILGTASSIAGNFIGAGSWGGSSSGTTSSGMQTGTEWATEYTRPSMNLPRGKGFRFG